MKDAKDGIVLMTADQLRGLLSEVVETALAKAGTRDDSDVMDMELCAKLIGVHPKTVREMVKHKGLPTLRRIGKLWRFSRREVLEWMARRKSA